MTDPLVNWEDNIIYLVNAIPKKREKSLKEKRLITLKKLAKQAQKLNMGY